MKILVTGGIGYIGSHTCVELLNAGYEVVIIDNLCNSKREIVDKIKLITGKDVYMYEANLENENILDEIFSSHKIGAVIHFAAMKCISESIKIPIKYYENNLSATLKLLKVMDKYNVKKIIFSSSASVYGQANKLPIKEECSITANNPYGNTKVIIENILNDVYKSDNQWSIAILRYFNPIGAHSSGIIGEVPNGIPSNLLPYVAKVAIGELECVNVYGNDYHTLDGTGVRDYIHVVDLSLGHIKALDKILISEGIDIYNLGTGRGYSVLEIIKEFEKVSGKKVKYKVMPRRKGDIASCYADVTKAEKVLGWQTKRNLADMCRDLWNFTLNNQTKSEVAASVEITGNTQKNKCF